MCTRWDLHYYLQNSMNKFIAEIEAQVGEKKVRINEPMNLHTTFKIGGAAEYYIDISSVDDFVVIYRIAKKHQVPIFVFGGGSNIIVSDKGISGLVIKNNCRKFEIFQAKGSIKKSKIDIDEAYIKAEAGTIMNQLVRFTIDNSLSGLEYQMGLPGTVGGGIFMNSNFPKEKSFVGDSVWSVMLLADKGDIKTVGKSYFRFAYDSSILQETNEIVLSAVFKLKKMDKEELNKRAMGALTYRTSSQPKGASAGCTFRNISIVEAMTVPTPGNVTSAGYLIDKAGLKGKRIGDAMVSPLHANFILNIGVARAEDVSELTKIIKEEVLRKFGVHLHFEVRTVGF